MSLQELAQTLAIAALPVVFAITLHEAAHGYVARFFGDSTAERAGRISLNPARHIDPFGTIALPMLTLWLGGILFGWAKPVPVDFNQLRNPKKDMFWVALAGPASNFLMALMWALLANLAWASPDAYYSEPLLAMAKFGIQINLILIALNLLPLPPLDGGRIAVSLLPHPLALALSRIEPFGLYILIFMALTPILAWVLNPFVSGLMRLINFIV